ncbi:MAG: TonB-dependent receptor [Saprospiraceae bacterium]|nr:TonB-dependent receptor [Saprospiraceae bacterium]
MSTILLFAAVVRSQPDSAMLLRPEQLGRENILDRDPTLQKTQAISATRSPEDVDQLPYMVWVITADEILRYGFVTLGDVLKAAPGIRVSQPGNALEGETFLMRGMSGNQYVKILINDVPVKSALANGMSIGSQLPIRQAERIEIMYGPASSIYGNEACAGVVNIILKETERPVYTQADLSFGRFGYNNLDLMFGGKIGRDKRIFRFSLYGSSTVRDDTDLFYDANLFNVDNYLTNGIDTSFYLNNPNYRGTTPGSHQAKLAQIPHESRLFGINLTWRGIHLTYHRMGRFDHSALGLNPLAVGWYNPSNRLAERTETFSLGFQRKRKIRTTYNTFSFLRYKLDNTSTTTYVYDRLSAAVYDVNSAFLTSDSARQALRQDLYRMLASDERYTTANGIDLRYESRMTAAIRPNFYLETGMQITLSQGVPAHSYYAIPVEVRVDGSSNPPDVKPFYPFADGDVDVAGYAQFEYRGKRLFVVGGGLLNWMFDYGVVPAPRLGAQYRIDSTWSVRANFASGYRRPSLYASNNAYLISPLFTDKVYRHSDPFFFGNAEQTYGGELGVRYRMTGLQFDGLFFYQEARQLLREGYFTQQAGIIPTWRYGFANAPGLAMMQWGTQGILRWETALDISRGTKETVNLIWRVEMFAQYCRGKEWFGHEFPSTDDVRNQPRWMFQFRTSWRTNRFELMLSSNRQQSALSKAVTWQQSAGRPVIIERYPAFRTWDAAIRFNLSDHFLVYIQGQNLFNKRYAGLDASGTPDDLLYNPQPGRQIRLGVNYNMNLRVKQTAKDNPERKNTRTEDDTE